VQGEALDIESTGYRKRENEEKRGAVFHREVAMLPVIQLIIK
jgi:hypothetical protein